MRRVTFPSQAGVLNRCYRRKQKYEPFPRRGISTTSDCCPETFCRKLPRCVILFPKQRNTRQFSQFQSKGWNGKVPKYGKFEENYQPKVMTIHTDCTNCLFKITPNSSKPSCAGQQDDECLVQHIWSSRIVEYRLTVHAGIYSEVRVLVGDKHIQRLVATQETTVPKNGQPSTNQMIIPLVVTKKDEGQRITSW